MSKISDVNPTFAIIWFIVSTIIYGFFKYFIALIDINDINNSTTKNFNDYINSNNNNNNIKTNLDMLLYGFLFFVIISEFFINLSLTRVLCDKTPQYYTATYSTIIPWVLIFTTLIALLRLFPGWLSPFSNTFGYGIAIIMGIKDLFNNLIRKDFKGLDENSRKALTHITNDRSILINEISMENIDDFWNNMSSIFNVSQYTTQNKLQLFNIIRAKTIIAEVIWFILTGLLIISISYNNIINSNCEKKLENMKNV